jgi:RND family efflux transporter MFP subunit
VAEIPGRTFQAVVAKVSGGLDAASRTMLVQVRIPNGEHILKPGMYGTIVFDSLTSTDDGPGTVPVLIPASALIVRPTGQFVAVVDVNDTVRMQAVSTGRDYGRQIEVLKGLNGGETIVLDPDVDLKDGTVIKPELKAMRAD